MDYKRPMKAYINQKNLKMFWPNMADKYASAVTKNVGLRCNSGLFSAGHFLTMQGSSVVSLTASPLPEFQTFHWIYSLFQGGEKVFRGHAYICKLKKTISDMYKNTKTCQRSKSYKPSFYRFVEGTRAYSVSKL